MGWGDELMVSGMARVMQQTDPRKVRVTFQGVPRWNDIWNGNPRIARLGEEGDFQELPARDMDNNRPYHTGKTAERWYYNPAFRAEPGEIYFTPQEVRFGSHFSGRIILEPHLKSGASPNKQWGWDNWQRLADRLCAAGLRISQTGPHGTRLLRGADLVQTSTFRQAAAVLAYARAAVLPEGGLHHAAAAVGLPAVVLFGGYISPEQTGYAIHRNLFTGGEPCGMRIPCSHCATAMQAITPEMVTNSLMEILHAN